MRAAGKVVADAMEAMRRSVRPGVTTGELDAIAGDVFKRAGARSGPQLDYDFPGVTCISVNDEAVHGIPGKRKLRGGDLVKLDVTAELNGFYADACISESTYARLAAHFDAPQLLDLVFTVGCYDVLSMAFKSFAVALEPGVTPLAATVRARMYRRRESHS